MIARSLDILLDSRAWLLWISLALLALLLALLPLPAAIALVTATGYGIALLLRPSLGLYALVFALPFSPLLRLSLGPATLGPTDVLVAATLFAWFLRYVILREPLQKTPLLWLLIPFFLVLLYSTLAAKSLEQAFPELAKWAEVLFAYFLGVQLLGPRHRLPFALAILTAGSLEALVGLRQFFFRIGPEAFALGPFLRAYGTFGQPNPYAGYLGLVLPLGLALTLWYGQQAWANRRRIRAAVRTLLSALLVLGLTGIIAAGIIASWSRGAWLGAFASSVAVLAFFSFSSRLLLLLGALATLVASPLFPSAVKARLADITLYLGTWNARGVVVTDENFSVIERVAHWQAAWEMFADHPWLGIGVGNWDVVYPRYAIPPWFDAMGHAHNVLFHYAAVAGILGALTYLWLWLGGLVAGVAAISRSNGRERALAIGVLGLLIHLSVHNQLDNLWVQGMPLLIALALSQLPLTAAPSPA